MGVKIRSSKTLSSTISGFEPSTSHTLSGPGLLLTKNYSKIIIFEEITNLTRNSLKKPFFPEDFEGTNSPEIITTKIILREVFVVTISGLRGYPLTARVQAELLSF